MNRYSIVTQSFINHAIASRNYWKGRSLPSPPLSQCPPLTWINCHGKYISIVKFWKQFTFSSIVNRSWRFLSQNSVLKKNDWCFSRCIADLVYDVTTLDTRKYDVTMFNLIPSTFDHNCRFSGPSYSYLTSMNFDNASEAAVCSCRSEYLTGLLHTATIREPTCDNKLLPPEVEKNMNNQQSSLWKKNAFR
jgi:hypothetical protein